MEAMRRFMIAALGAIVLAGAVAMIGSQRGEAAAATPVQVTNTAAQWLAPVPITGSGAGGAVPVSGSVGITGTVPVSGTIQALQSGAWTVNVHDVDAARRPVHAHAEFSVPSGSAGSGGTLIYTVPAGSRLIVEYLSARIIGGRKDETLFGIAGSAANHVQTFGATAVANTVMGGWIMSQTVKMYFEPGEQLYVDSNRTINSNGSGATSIAVMFNLDGRLVDYVP